MNNDIAVSSIVTIPIKLLLVGYLASTFSFSKKFAQYALISFFVLLAGLFTISDGSPFFNSEILNRNETIAYLLAIIYIIPDSRSKLRLRLLVILIIASFLVQSRQLFVGFLFSIIIYFFINYKDFFKYGLFVIIFSFLFLNFFSNIFFKNLDEYNQRRYDFSKIEERTRGDRIRYFNIMFGLENYTKSPLIGQGTGSYVRANPLNRVAHNSFVTSLYENGIIGLVLFLLLLYKSIPPRYNKLSFIIFFIMIGQLFFIESMGKFFIYIYFIKSFLFYKEKNLKLANDKS